MIMMPKTGNLEEISKIMKVLVIIALLIAVGFFFMVGSLVFLHSYLIARNLTTCKNKIVELIN